MESPSQEKIQEGRSASALSQTAAAELIYSTKRTWQDWEAGKAKMPPGLWELFMLKTGQQVVVSKCFAEFGGIQANERGAHEEHFHRVAQEEPPRGRRG
jgi:hypothetical protein